MTNDPAQSSTGVTRLDRKSPMWEWMWRVSMWKMTQHNPAQGYQAWSQNHLCGNECKGFQNEKWPSAIQHMGAKVGAKLTYMGMKSKEFRYEKLTQHNPAQEYQGWSQNHLCRNECEGFRHETKDFNMKNHPAPSSTGVPRLEPKSPMWEWMWRVSIWKSTQHNPAQGYQGWSQNHLCGNESKGF